MKRRNFMGRITAGAGMLAASTLPYGISRMLAPSLSVDYSMHLRPPGALADEQAFVNACIGCGLCAEVCPPRCIRFYQREGGDKVNTPYIDPTLTACTLCSKCMQVCPTEALTETPREQVDMGIAQIDRTACYPWVDRGVCGACAVICPLGDKAIGFDFANMYRPIVKESCVGCGLCVEVCPHPSLPIRVVERAKGTVTHHAI